MAAGTDTPISFDEFSKIRILPSQYFEESDKLKDECKDFTSKIGEFHTIVQTFMDMLQEKAKEIEIQKLKAIGFRNTVESEQEKRSGLKKQYQMLINDRQAELDRLTVQYESLQNVLAEQQRQIESLSSK
ncbi:Intraflagellar transport protein 20 [Phlyctochytrium planicorne]|nr:Intraflagellar transport protein 20 [Phlyctochytrium planicorne]